MTVSLARKLTVFPPFITTDHTSQSYILADDWDKGGSISLFHYNQNLSPVSMESSLAMCLLLDIKALDEFEDLAVNQHVLVIGKVTSVQPSEKVHMKSKRITLMKEDFTLANCTSVI